MTEIKSGLPSSSIHNDPVKNFFFHPFAKEHSTERSIASIMTIIGLSILTGGIYLVAYVAIKIKDHYDVSRLKSGSPIAGTAAKTGTVFKKDLPLKNAVDSVSTQFWEHYFSNRSRHTLLEMVLISKMEGQRTPEQVSETLVEYYLDEKLIIDPNFSIDGHVEKNLKEEIIGQFTETGKFISKETPVDPTPAVSVTIEKEAKITNRSIMVENHDLGKTVRIRTYSTGDDGSCGLHALLGTSNSEGTYICNAKEARLKFANWIRDKHKSKELPEEIDAVLIDYFKYFDVSHQGFKNSKGIKKLRNEVMEKYRQKEQEISKYTAQQQALTKEKKTLESRLNKLDEAKSQDEAALQEIVKISKRLEKIEIEQEKIIEIKKPLNKELDLIREEFTRNDLVIEAYAKNLEGIRVWLLQDELKACAICFDKKLHLYQPSTFPGELPGHSLTNPNGSETVSVWYNGATHYERAKVI